RPRPSAPFNHAASTRPGPSGSTALLSRALRRPPTMPESTKSPADVLERVPNFSDLEVAFGARADAFLTREQMGDEFYGERNEFTRHVGSLFFSGGSVLPDGRRWKEGVNPKKAGRAVAAWLRSFDPKHEI